MQTRALESALVSERKALEAQDPEALDASGGEKHTSLSNLEDLDRERRDLLSRHGFARDDSGMISLLQACGPGHPLDQLWTQLREIALRCRDANQINGAIVQLRRQQISRALQILRGGTEAASSPTYTADGSSRSDASRVFGSA